MEEYNNSDESLKRGLVLGALFGVLGTCAIFLAVYLGNTFIGKASSKNSVANADTLKKIEAIEGILQDNFYVYNEDVSLDHLEDGIYLGMMKSMGDPYSEYYSAEELKGVFDDSEGISYGIGCVVTINDDGLPLIMSIVDDSPAAGADVRAGDIIMEVEGESMMGLTLSQVVGRIKGRDGTPVEITFYREGETEYLVKTIIRGEAIQDTNVSSGTLKDDERIGYIFIKEFDDASTEQFVEALEILREEEEIEGLIIDIRGNPGGNLSSVVEICRNLLPEGIIVYEEDKNGNRKEFRCEGDKEIDIPMVVLVNGYSASASEILAGAIQDYNKGTIIGTTTYGKGIVQTLRSLGDGSAIKYTKSAYFTPSGKSVQGVGVEPDIVIELDEEAYRSDGEDSQFNKAVEILQTKMGEK